VRNLPRLIDQTRLREEILEPGEELIVGMAQPHEPEVQQLQRARSPSKTVALSRTHTCSSRVGVRWTPRQAFEPAHHVLQMLSIANSRHRQESKGAHHYLGLTSQPRVRSPGVHRRGCQTELRHRARGLKTTVGASAEVVACRAW
jgi:hypothetical protein